MISSQQVKRIVFLARLGLSQKERKKMEKELAKILDYFKLLDQIDLSQTPPLFYALSVKNVMRQDKVERFPVREREKLLNQAPAREGRYIKVKEIL